MRFFALQKTANFGTYHIKRIMPHYMYRTQHKHRVIRGRRRRSVHSVQYKHIVLHCGVCEFMCFAL